MADDYRQNVLFSKRRITLDSLKDRLHSLNMRMLLAMQNHDEEMQEQIRGQMDALQSEISRINLKD